MSGESLAARSAQRNGSCVGAQKQIWSNGHLGANAILLSTASTYGNQDILKNWSPSSQQLILSEIAAWGW